MENPSLLIHTCCAPCLCGLYENFKNEYNITAFWNNINIHPYSEYQKRLNALYKFQVKTNINVVYKDEYNIHKWLSIVKDTLNKPERCKLCYSSRIELTAEFAKKKKFDFFTTTLLYSKYQYHDEIIKICKDLSTKHEIKFLYKDFRKYWKQGITISKDYELYRQKYCGCILSEYKDG